MAEPPHASDFDAQTVNYVVGSAVGLLTICVAAFEWLRRKWAGQARERAEREQLRAEVAELRARQEAGDVMRSEMSHQLEALRRQVDQLPTRDDMKELRDVILGTNLRIDRLLENRG